MFSIPATSFFVLSFLIVEVKCDQAYPLEISLKQVGHTTPNLSDYNSPDNEIIEIQLRLKSRPIADSLLLNLQLIKLSTPGWKLKSANSRIAIFNRQDLITINKDWRKIPSWRLYPILNSLILAAKDLSILEADELPEGRYLLTASIMDTNGKVFLADFSSIALNIFWIPAPVITSIQYGANGSITIEWSKTDFSTIENNFTPAYLVEIAELQKRDTNPLSAFVSDQIVHTETTTENNLSIKLKTTNFRSRTFAVRITAIHPKGSPVYRSGGKSEIVTF